MTVELDTGQKTQTFYQMIFFLRLFSTSCTIDVIKGVHDSPGFERSFESFL